MTNDRIEGFNPTVHSVAHVAPVFLNYNLLATDGHSGGQDVTGPFGDFCPHCVFPPTGSTVRKPHGLYIRISMFIVFTAQPLKVAQAGLQETHTTASRTAVLLSVSVFSPLVSDGSHRLQTPPLALELTVAGGAGGP